MRPFLYCLLPLLLVGAGCKKASPEAAAQPAPEVAQASPTPEPTPESTPEPTPVPIDTTARVVVLCYHRFEDKPKDDLALKPEEFEAQMQALKDHGIEVISMEDFLAWRRGEKSIPPKAAIITIDDGYISGYTTAWPILKKYDYPFTMYIYTDYVKGGPRSGGQSMTWEQLAEMRDAGVDIGSHTISHSALNAKKGKSDEAYKEWLKAEIAGSKEAIESKLGIGVKTIAYPYGLHNETVRQAVIDAGYEAGFSVEGKILAHDAPEAMLGRYAIGSTKPAIFQQAVGFAGATSSGGSAPAAIPASAAMITQPMDGETIADPLPELKINLAALGNVDPKSITMRVSGIGLVPATYDPESKLLTYKLTQRIRARQVTVIVGATADNRKVETRWSFNFDPSAVPAAN